MDAAFLAFVPSRGVVTCAACLCRFESRCGSKQFVFIVIYIGKNWFTNRVVDEWNSLSSHVVSANTIDTFKKRLDRFMDGEGRW